MAVKKINIVENIISRYNLLDDYYSCMCRSWGMCYTCFKFFALIKKGDIFSINTGYNYLFQDLIL